MANDGLTEGQRQESRAQRRSRERAQKELMAADKMRKMMASRRESRKSIPNGERHAQQQRCNARFAAKRNSPRAESIIGTCPDAATSSTPNLASSTKDYTIGTDGNASILTLFLYTYLISGKAYIPTELL